MLALGVAASVAANVLHAHNNPISQAISAWPPLALLLNVELISRYPVRRRALARVRVVATAGIAGIAAWVSYCHMAAVAARYGETGAAPYLLPLSVDGLIVVASVCLVELAGQVREAGQASAAAPDVPVRPPAAEAGTSTVDVPVRVPVQVPRRINGVKAATLNAENDEELLAILADATRVPRDPDGTVPVRRAAKLLGTGHDRARRLLGQAGLRATPRRGKGPTLQPALAST